MGKQSARIFFNGKDHKEIYMNRNYHDKLHEADNLLWEKLEGEDVGGYDFRFSVQNVTSNAWTTTLQAMGDFAIDWGDGTVEQYNLSSLQLVSHTYPRWTSNETFIAISGNLQDIALGENEQLLNVLTPFPRSMKNKTDFSFCFDGCNNLRSIVGNLFKYCPNAETLAGFLRNCTMLTEIPVGIFGNCRKAKDFSYCFYCLSSKVTTIPESLFDYCYSAENFRYCFAYTYINTIPGGLFKNTNALSFEGCFYEYNGSYIPEGVFEGCRKAENFKNCFYDSRYIASIPANLFADCHSAKSMYGTFYSCENIQEIPATLFDNCLEITDFTGTFAGCSSASGLAPELWLRTNVLASAGCFNSGAYENYLSIPNAWK